MIYTGPQTQLAASLLLRVMNVESKRQHHHPSIQPSVFRQDANLNDKSVEQMRRCKWDEGWRSAGRHSISKKIRSEVNDPGIIPFLPADTCETNEVYAIVYIWKQIQWEHRMHVRIGDCAPPSHPALCGGPNRGIHHVQQPVWHWHRLTWIMQPQMNSDKVLFKTNLIQLKLWDFEAWGAKTDSAQAGYFLECRNNQQTHHNFRKRFQIPFLKQCKSSIWPGA